MMERAGLRSEVLRPFRGEPPATTGATARGIAPAPAAKAPRAEDGRASLLCPPGKPLFVPHTSLQALLLRPQGESCVPPCFLNTSTRGYNSEKTFRHVPQDALRSYPAHTAQGRRAAGDGPFSAHRKNASFPLRHPAAFPRSERNRVLLCRTQSLPSFFSSALATGTSAGRRPGKAASSSSGTQRMSSCTVRAMSPCQERTR